MFAVALRSDLSPTRQGAPTSHQRAPELSTTSPHTRLCLQSMQYLHEMLGYFANAGVQASGAGGDDRSAMGMLRGVLGVADYERVFEVLDRCEGAADMRDFRHRVVTALSKVFGVTHASYFSGKTLPESFFDPDPDATGDPQGTLRKKYVRKWARQDVFRTKPAIHLLESTGGVGLGQLTQLPPSAVEYVSECLESIGLQSCYAFTMRLPDAGCALIGMYDPDPTAISAQDSTALRLLFRHLGKSSWPALDHGPGEAPPTTTRQGALTGLTPRQQEVVYLISEGLTNAQIAAKLTLTENTVKKYVSRALATTECQSRTELAIRADRIRKGSYTVWAPSNELRTHNHHCLSPYRFASL